LNIAEKPLEKKSCLHCSVFFSNFGLLGLKALSRRISQRREAAGADEFKNFWEKISAEVFEFIIWSYCVSLITSGILFIAYQFFLKNERKRSQKRVQTVSKKGMEIVSKTL
jgi:hypothetical protein